MPAAQKVGLSPRAWPQIVERLPAQLDLIEAPATSSRKPFCSMATQRLKNGHKHVSWQFEWPGAGLSLAALTAAPNPSHNLPAPISCRSRAASIYSVEECWSICWAEKDRPKVVASQAVKTNSLQLKKPSPKQCCEETIARSSPSLPRRRSGHLQALNRSGEQRSEAC